MSFPIPLGSIYLKSYATIYTELPCKENHHIEVQSLSTRKMADHSQKVKALACFLLLCMLLSEVTCIQPHVGNPQEVALKSGEVDTVGSCSFVVQIKTSCSAFAGTDDRISIAFGDAFGNQVYVSRLDDPTTDTFERCSTDSFTILGPCVYSVCYLYLMRVGSDAWKPEWVKVFYGRSQSVVFYYDMFIPDRVWYGFDLCQTALAKQSAQSALTM